MILKNIQKLKNEIGFKDKRFFDILEIGRHDGACIKCDVTVLLS